MGLVVFFFLLLHVVKLVFGFQRKLKTVYVTYQNGVSMFKPGDMVSSDWTVVRDTPSQWGCIYKQCKIGQLPYN